MYVKHFTMTKKATKQRFPFQCQTKANTIKRGKSIERNFYIDFTSKQQDEQSISSELSNKEKIINENIINENRFSNTSNRTMGDNEDIRYRNFRKDRLNYKNYLLSTDSSLTSSLYSPSISTSASSRSSSVKNRAKIPTLPENLSSQKKVNSKKIIENKKNPKKHQKTVSRNNRVQTREVFLSENNYDSEYESSVDYLISDYDDYRNYDYDYDYDSIIDLPINTNKKAKIHFIKGNSNLYNISEISELNSQSDIKSNRSRHHHHQKQTKQKLDSKQQKKQQNQIKKQQNEPIYKIDNIPKKKTILQPKFCMTEDLTESFFEDLTDHPRQDEEEECNEKIQQLLNDITTEINRVQSRSRIQLKISSSIHIFANNPTIQRIKGRIPSSDVYMHVPRFDSEDEQSVSQMSYEDNDLTISAISFNNFGSPSPIKAKGNSKNSSNNKIKNINIPDTDSEEINHNANNEYIKRIKSRNISYQQMINEQNSNEKQKLIVKREPNSSKEQINRPPTETKINQVKPSNAQIPSKNQDNTNKKSSRDSIQKSQNANPDQTKKLIQSLFLSNDHESEKQTTDDNKPILKISKAVPLSHPPTNTGTNDQYKNRSMNASVQSFIQQNNEIIEDLKQPKFEKQSSLEAINLMPNITSSLITDDSKQKDANANDNKNISDLAIPNNKTISNLSTINKISNSASSIGQKGDQNTNTNDLLSDSYEYTLSLDQKANSNHNQNNSSCFNHNLYEEETYNTTAMSSMIDQSNIADEIILSEIRSYFDESSSHGETHKVTTQNTNKNNKDKNDKDELNNKSLSSLNNDDYLED